MLAAGDVPTSPAAPAVQFQVNVTGLYVCKSSAEIPLNAEFAFRTFRIGIP
jgi:hypothetical protein